MNPNIDMTAVIAEIEALHEWEAVQAEATAEVEARKDALKAILTANDLEELTAGRFIVRWTTVTTNRIDTGLLKKQLPDIAKQFTKASTSRRFTVSK